MALLIQFSFVAEVPSRQNPSALDFQTMNLISGQLQILITHPK